MDILRNVFTSRISSRFLASAVWILFFNPQYKHYLKMGWYNDVIRMAATFKFNQITEIVSLTNCYFFSITVLYLITRGPIRHILDTGIKSFNRSGNNYSCPIKANLQSEDLIVKRLQNICTSQEAFLDYNDEGTMQKFLHEQYSS